MGAKSDVRAGFFKDGAAVCGEWEWGPAYRIGSVCADGRKKVHHGDTEGTEKREISACNLERRVEFGIVNVREVDVGT
jgi:hypothetical protein